MATSPSDILGALQHFVASINNLAATLQTVTQSSSGAVTILLSNSS